MANPQHVDLLKQGVEAWNVWRELHPEIQPDLSGAELSELDLSRAYLADSHLHAQAAAKRQDPFEPASPGLNLQGANLDEAHLFNVKLDGANLSYASLKGAEIICDFSRANFHGAKLQQVVFDSYNAFDLDLSQADLSGANLRGVHMSGSNLREANLFGANLEDTFLYDADLSNANLGHANLRGTMFRDANLKQSVLNDLHLDDTSLLRADLSGAFLQNTIFYRADLTGACLECADLRCVSFIETHLDGARFAGSLFSGTGFLRVDLFSVHGLDEVIHQGPSSLDGATLALSGDNLPLAFLRGTGIPEILIGLVRSGNLQYRSCLIYYAQQDRDFAERLYADLQARGFRCWLVLQRELAHSRPDFFLANQEYFGTGHVVQSPDKLIAVLSEHFSLNIVDAYNVFSACQFEDERQKHTIFPVCLDLSYRVQDEHESKRIASTRAYINQRHIEDFCAWKDEELYRQALDRLTHDLEVSFRA